MPNNWALPPEDENPFRSTLSTGLTCIVVSLIVTAMPRLLPLPTPGMHPEELPGPVGGETRVLPLSKAVKGPAPLFCMPIWCWWEYHGYGSL